MDDSDREEEFLSARDMRLWADQQFKDASKALELRLRDAAHLANAYAAGELNPRQAEELQSRYYHRWGEACPGVSVTDAMTDAQILAGVDKAADFSRGPFDGTTGPHAAGTERFQQRLRSAGRDSR